MTKAKTNTKETAKKAIQWTNKWSGEKGFVKCLNRKEGFFENTFNKEDAKLFAVSALTQTINLLNKFEPNNEYASVDA